MFSCERIFKNNSHYNDYFGPYGDAFVGAIEWLFTFESQDKRFNPIYYFGDVNTPDFMSCVLVFMRFARQKQAKLTLKDELNNLRTFSSENVITHINDGERNVYEKVTPMFVQAILWSAFIFFKFKSEKEPKNVKIQNSAKCLYDALKNELNSYIDVSESTFLIDQIEPTLKKFWELAPTDEEIAEQQTPHDEDNDAKQLDFFLADPLYQQCYEGIFEVLGVCGLHNGTEFTEGDYLEVYTEAEKLVNEVLESKHPEIAIRNIQTRLRANYPEEKVDHTTYVTPEYLFGRLIECVFCIVTFDKLDNKSNLVIKAFEDFRTIYDSHSIYLTYKNEKLWKMMAQRIPNEREKMSQCPPPAPAPKPIEDKNQNDELQTKYDELQKQYEEVKEELEAYKQEPITEEAHDKVRLEVFCRLLEKAGVDFVAHGIKAESARFTKYITGMPFNTCKNYMTNRDLNQKTHADEILKVNTSLKKIGIDWQL